MPMWSVSILSTSMGECLRCLPPLMLTGKDYADLLPSPLVLTMMSLSRATTSRWHGIMRCIYRRECRSFLSKQGRSLPGDTPCLCFCFHRQIGMRPLPSLRRRVGALKSPTPLRHSVDESFYHPVPCLQSIMCRRLALLTRQPVTGRKGAARIRPRLSAPILPLSTRREALLVRISSKIQSLLSLKVAMTPISRWAPPYGPDPFSFWGRILLPS
ncbi:unnamed protein product [Symbiodinium sp. KB8]|nr:unnamed protein product [Symbiodinium sp. KB8]